jgi:lysophospholipase L1-like esterase
MNRRHAIRLLMATQAVTLALLLALAHHYRLPQKAWRSWVVENRIPGVTPAHKFNRNYQSSRELFRAYRTTDHPILFFGDSHIRLASWHELLGRNDLANRGIDGDTLDGVTARLADEANSKPTAIVILAGSNDLRNGASMESMKQSMTAMLNEAGRLWPHPTPLVITSIPPVASWHVDHQQFNAQTREFNSWLKTELSVRPATRFLDLHSALADASGNLAPSMTSDGVHLSSNAYLAYRRQLEQLLP